MPILHSFNEWSRLRSVVVGDATDACWPDHDPVFREQVIDRAFQDQYLSPGSVPSWIIEETNHELDMLCDVLREFGAEVHRPKHNDFLATAGMYNYCPRDRVIVAGERVIDVSMLYPCRDQEIKYLRHLWHQDQEITMPKNQGLVADAANVCRLGNDWLFLLSISGNQAALEWLQAQVPDVRIHACNFYQGVHIDSTVVPIREGLVALNAERVTLKNLPDCLRSWDHIWVERCEPRSYYKYPYSSAWMGLNMLSLDGDHVIVDALQTDLIQQLEQHRVTAIPLTLSHSRTLGGGFHCVTLDLWRCDD